MSTRCWKDSENFALFWWPSSLRAFLFFPCSFTWVITKQSMLFLWKISLSFILKMSKQNVLAFLKWNISLKMLHLSVLTFFRSALHLPPFFSNLNLLIFLVLLKYNFPVNILVVKSQINECLVCFVSGEQWETWTTDGATVLQSQSSFPWYKRCVIVVGQSKKSLHSLFIH